MFFLGPLIGWELQKVIGFSHGECLTFKFQFMLLSICLLDDPYIIMYSNYHPKSVVCLASF